MAVHLAQLTDQPLDLTYLIDLVSHEGAGAVASFIGTVRDRDGGRSVTALEYEAHPDAEDFLRRSAERIAEPGLEIAVAHRVGTLHLGDAAVVAAVASAHRPEAFAAVAALVEDVKATVPIWKHQFYADGSEDWVNSP